MVGGDDTQPGEFPFSALLGYSTRRKLGQKRGRPVRYVNETKWICSGTLINHWYVLTAAHCQGKVETRRISKLRLGDWEVQGHTAKPNDGLPEEQDFEILNHDVIVHDGYQIVFENNLKNFVNDIALIKLPRKATINAGVQTACLPFQSPAFNFIDLVGEIPTVVGWGMTDAYQLSSWDGVGSRKQQKLEVCENLFNL